MSFLSSSSALSSSFGNLASGFSFYNPWTHRIIVQPNCQYDNKSEKSMCSPNLDDLVSKLIEPDQHSSGETVEYNVVDRLDSWSIDQSKNSNRLTNINYGDNELKISNPRHSSYNVTAGSYYVRDNNMTVGQMNPIGTQQFSDDQLTMNNQNINPTYVPEHSCHHTSSTQSLSLSLLDKPNHNLNLNGSQIVPQIRSIRARPSVPDMGPISKFHLQVEKCCEQLKLLEKERKKIEAELSEKFPGHKISSANNIPIQRPPVNPSRIDRLIIEMLKVHAKLVTIIAIMEQLRENRDLSPYIHDTIQKWLQGISNLRMRKEELLISRSIGLNGGVNDEINESAMDQITQIIANICTSIRMVRTILWCSHITTIYFKSF